MRDIKIIVVGEFTPEFKPHPATNAGLKHAAASLDITLDVEWVSTADLVGDVSQSFLYSDGIYIAPGSPYASMEGALNAITYGREKGVPTIGTCGGYQHIVIEYARRVLGRTSAQHAEYEPTAQELFVSQLSCSLVGQRLDVQIKPGTRAAAAYQRQLAIEEYYCNFGLNPAYVEILESGGLCVSGTDADGEARILELPGHPFFMATLFVPPLTSTYKMPHPLLLEFIRSAQQAKQERNDTMVVGDRR